MTTVTVMKGGKRVTNTELKLLYMCCKHCKKSSANTVLIDLNPLYIEDLT